MKLSITFGCIYHLEEGRTTQLKTLLTQLNSSFIILYLQSSKMYEAGSHAEMWKQYDKVQMDDNKNSNRAVTVMRKVKSASAQYEQFLYGTCGVTVGRGV